MEFARPFSVLDGGLSSALELAGHDLSGELWTARLLTEAPDAIVTAHLGFLRAGAEVLITSSYQASIAGFIGAGISRSDAVTLIGLTTELAREAVVRHRREATHPTDPLVAASVGPYGAVLADGSEYTGVYDLSAGDLAEFHRARLEFLIASEPDLLAAETIPSLAEARAVIDAFGRLPAMPSWISFSCRDGATTCAGDPIEAADRGRLQLATGHRRRGQLQRPGSHRRTPRARRDRHLTAARRLLQQRPAVGPATALLDRGAGPVRRRADARPVDRRRGATDRRLLRHRVRRDPVVAQPA